MNHRHPGIRSRNNTVSPSVERLVDEMLIVDDATRPSACELLPRVQAVVDGFLSGTSESSTGSDGSLRLTEVWRDEIYGDIRLSKYEIELVNTREMQRLRRIRQLGLTYFAFGSGDHSRLSHSVGTLYRVDQLLRTMEESAGVRIDPETRLVARAYALTHDVTHIPFGHTLEDEFAFYPRHDENEPRIKRLILDSSSTLGSVLEKSEIGRQVRNLYDSDASIHRRSEVQELVSGMIGADLLDYIDRDARNLGLDHHIDTAIFRQFSLHEKPGGDDRPRLVSLLTGDYGIRLDREFAIEWVMRERYALFLKAYTHRAKIKASVLLGKAMSIALNEFKTVLLTEEDVEWYSDDGLLDFLAHLPRATRVVDIARSLIERRLPVAVFRARLLDDGNLNLDSYAARRGEIESDLSRFGLFPAASRLEVERHLAQQTRVMKPDEVFVYAARNAPGLKRTESHRRMHDAGAPVLPQSPWFEDLRRKHLGLWELWVFAAHGTSTEMHGRLAAAAADRFGLANQLNGRPAQSLRLW